MKKCIFALLVLSAMTWQVAQAQLPTEVLGPGIGSGRTEFHQPQMVRTLSPDTCYILTGLYFVDTLKTIEIPAGTVVKGDTAATLIIARGGRVEATGEECCPVVFTSLKDPGQRARGDWGGVVILGAAPVNKVNPVIEGGIIAGTFGGNDPNDSSGIFRYVRIEFPGYRFQLNNEINGLTQGGVGAGTELHHVQVTNSFDDSYEWFGGTVDAKYLVAFAGTDDEFDTDFGFRGRIQYAFGLRDCNQSDPTGDSNGFESDNDGSGSGDLPLTRPIFSNVTMIGPYRTDAFKFCDDFPNLQTFGWGARIRRNSRLNCYNSIIAGYPGGMRIESAGTHAAALSAANGAEPADHMEFCRICLTARDYDTSPPGPCPGVPGHVHDESSWPCNGADGVGVYRWFEEIGPPFVAPEEWENMYSDTNCISVLELEDLSSLTDPRPIPSQTSPAASGSDFGDPDLDPAFFERTYYKGAFEPGLSMAAQWTHCWTNFDPQNTDYTNGIDCTPTGIGDDSGDVPLASGITAENYPNPFNPTTTIRFSLPEAAHLSLEIFDVSGRLVRTLIDGNRSAGFQSVIWNGKDDSGQAVSTGVYFYKFTTSYEVLTRKMVLLK